MKPREYQVEAVDLLWNYLHNGQGNPLGVAPTGTGKTFIMNDLTMKLCKAYKRLRVMSLTHDRTIIGQNADAMRRMWRTADVGIYSAGMKMRDTDSRITFAGIQSVYKIPQEFGKIGILFVDEAHLLSPNEGTMYDTFIRYLMDVNPKMRVIYLSATPYRLGQGHLLENPLVDGIAFDFTETEKFMWFIEEGYLCPLITKKAAHEIDITEVRMRGGEFNEKDLQSMSNTHENNRAVVEECIRYGSDRKHWMVYASGIEHGDALRQQFEAMGIPAVMLHATSPNRDSELEMWENQDYRALINVGLYTTGYDFPPLDLIADARATQSTALWVQKCGRGTRCDYADGYDLQTKQGRLDAIAASEKQNCLVLDFAGNTRRLGAINCPVIPAPRRKGDSNDECEAPVKVCPKCDAYHHTRAARCEFCGYEFPPPSNLDNEADDADILAKKSMEPRIEEVPVVDVTYRAGKSKDGKEYLRVRYIGFEGSYHHYLHPTSAYDVPKDRFKRWWWASMGKTSGKWLDYDYPTTVEDAAERAPDELLTPSKIAVDLNSRYSKIHKFIFEEEEDEEIF